MGPRAILDVFGKRKILNKLELDPRIALLIARSLQRLPHPGSATLEVCNKILDIPQLPSLLKSRVLFLKNASRVRLKRDVTR